MCSGKWSSMLTNITIEFDLTNTQNIVIFTAILLSVHGRQHVHGFKRYFKSLKMLSENKAIVCIVSFIRLILANTSAKHYVSNSTVLYLLSFSWFCSSIVLMS